MLTGRGVVFRASSDPCLSRLLYMYEPCGRRAEGGHVGHAVSRLNVTSLSTPWADCEQNNCEHFRNSESVMADPSSSANDSSDIHAHNESTIDVLHGTPKRAAGASSASTPSKHAKREARDRFIPNRSSMNFDNSLFELQRMRWRSDPFPFAIEYGPLLPLLRGARLSLSGRRQFK